MEILFKMKRLFMKIEIDSLISSELEFIKAGE